MTLREIRVESGCTTRCHLSLPGRVTHLRKMGRSSRAVDTSGTCFRCHRSYSCPSFSRLKRESDEDEREEWVGRWRHKCTTFYGQVGRRQSFSTEEDESSIVRNKACTVTCSGHTYHLGGECRYSAVLKEAAYLKVEYLKADSPSVFREKVPHNSGPQDYSLRVGVSIKDFPTKNIGIDRFYILVHKSVAT